ncbi:5'-methylthioadenosine/adenosylhomocysteine nucleosidase [Alkalicoccus urumqiensis]|uniref:adenosylhomocysteine nucleosidase n=1 Tax=Alkalicoccus urumqiensis TaxID=1548213 RepID=A0A2P6MGL5_ALKUR|nr:5'-methylthioadenosine/adenosylhomocysteine nucleosidase [Alkalicoccus urumqiensis]PRO65413.1 5'-methylthioadenosine/adenosylhomocysteine nucleosidase [Alkalicoccus urumqiensis]
MKIGVIGAMDEEIAHFTKHLTIENKHTLAGNTFVEAVAGYCEIVLAKTGVGKVNAAITAQKMLDYFEVDLLLFTGVAGACDPSLEIGDIVVSTDCQHHDIDASPLGFPKGTIPMFHGPSIFPADPEWQKRVLQAAEEAVNTKVIPGRIVSGEVFVADKQEVEMLHRTFDAACVEMEGAAVAQTAWLHSTPFVIIRSISDKANGEAPASFQQWLYEAAERSAALVLETIHIYNKEIRESR